ncbi:MAG: hypothetical protein WBL88_02270 [Nitrososphaeraceae archaeon]
MKNTGIAESGSHALDKIIPDDHENYSAILAKYLQTVFKLAQPFIQP